MAVSRALRRLAPVGLVAFAAGCASNAPQDTLQPEGPFASLIDNLIDPVFGVAAIVFVVVLGGALWLCVRFRNRGEGDPAADEVEMPEQVHGNFRLEIAWTIAPALILVAIGVPTVFSVFELTDDPPEDAVEVEVVGQQWWWEYNYDTDGDGDYDDITTANDLVMPAGREVSLEVTSRDVIHSFWVPKLNGKRDAVPNRTHPWKLEADEPGEYVGQCTEFCGLSHANMRITAVAVTEAEYGRWVERMQQDAEPFAESDDSLAAEGYRAFTGQLCASCHLIEGVNGDNFGPGGRIEDPSLQVSRHAPNLTHLMTRSTFAGGMFNLRKDTPECEELGPFWADEEENLERCLNRSALEAWLANPPAQKPMATEPDTSRTDIRGMPNLQLDSTTIDQLIAYLVTLK